MATPTPSFTPEQLLYMKEHAHEDRAPGIWAMTMISIVVILATTGMRLAARYHMRAKLLWDDWLIIAAAICGIGLACARLPATAEGSSGRHIWVVDPRLIPGFAKGSLAIAVLFSVDTGLIRASILMLYYRLFPMKSFHYQIWTVMAIQATNSVIAVFMFCFGCVPLKKGWDPTVKGHCLDPDKYILGTAIVNAIIDLAVFLLPIPVVLKLKLNKKRKYALCGVFGLGAITMATCIARAAVTPDYNTSDPTYDAVTVGHLSNAELMCGIFVANITVFGPPLARWVSGKSKNIFSSLRSSSNRSSGSGANKSPNNSKGMPAGKKLGGSSSSGEEASGGTTLMDSMWEKGSGKDEEAAYGTELSTVHTLLPIQMNVTQPSMA